MRLQVVAIVLTMAAAVCGCTSSEVPTWAIAATKSDALQARGWRSADQVHVSRIRSRHPKVIGATVARATVDDATTAPANAKDLKLYASGSAIAADSGSAAANKFQNTPSLFKEWDRRDQEEDRRIKAAITICRC